MHPILKHKVNPTGNRTDQQIIAAYAVATLPYGGTDFEVFQRADIDRYRGYSRSKSALGKRITAKWERRRCWGSC